MVPMVARRIMSYEGIGTRWCQWSQDGLCHGTESDWDGANGRKTDYAMRGSRSEMVPMLTRRIMPREGVGVRWCQCSQDGLCHERESEWDGANGRKTEYAMGRSRSEMVPMLTRRIMPWKGVGVRWCQWSHGRLCEMNQSELSWCQRSKSTEFWREKSLSPDENVKILRTSSSWGYRSKSDLSPLRIILVDTLTPTQLLNKIRHFYKSRLSITVFSKPRYWTYPAAD
jgi:hypothetical protein